MVFREKVSGVRADRPQLAKLMAGLKRGDIVVVTKLDRLGRSTRELLDLIERIGKTGAAFRSLGDPLWDTSSSQGRLLSTLLAAIAEFERELIRERTGEGRKRAMANGVKFGRKRKLSDYQRQEAIKRRHEAGNDTPRVGRRPIDRGTGSVQTVLEGLKKMPVSGASRVWLTSASSCAGSSAPPQRRASEDEPSNDEEDGGLERVICRFPRRNHE